MTNTWQDAGCRPQELRTYAELFKIFEHFLQSRQTALLIRGKFGSGKSTLCRKLVADLASRRLGPIPAYVDASRLTSEEVLDGVFASLHRRGVTDLTLETLHSSLQDGKIVLFFDSLDQLPFVSGESNVLTGIIEFVTDLYQSAKNAKVVLVVRDEFYRVSRTLSQFIANNNSSLLDVQGFTEPGQMRNFLASVDLSSGESRWEVLRRVMTAEPSLIELFAKPLILERYASIDLKSVREMDPSGASLANIFQLSFRRIDSNDRKSLRGIAYELYLGDSFHFAPHGRFLRAAGLDEEHFDDLLQRVGLLETTATHASFAHASFRDYFAAELIVRRIRRGEVVEGLKDRPLNYLVAEFVAGLIDEPAIDELLGALEADVPDMVKVNMLDLFSEIRLPNLRERVRQVLEKLVDGFNWASPVSEYSVYLAVVGGAYGFGQPVLGIIDAIRKMGLRAFFSLFLVTRDGFRYYGGSEDRCIMEWVKIAQNQRYGYIRHLLVYLLGEMGAKYAVPTLQKLTEEGEDSDLKALARAAVMSLVAR